MCQGNYTPGIKNALPTEEEVQVEKLKLEYEQLGKVVIAACVMPWAKDTGNIIAKLLLGHSIDHSEKIVWSDIVTRQKKEEADTMIVVTCKDNARGLAKDACKELKGFNIFKIDHKFSPTDMLVFEVDNPTPRINLIEIAVV